MDGVARCVSCLRRERRRDGEVIAVEMEGGMRQPGVPGELAAWRTLRRVQAGELAAPVAACAACGQPMFTVEGELPALSSWTFHHPDGAIVVGPDGRVLDGDDADADRRVEALHRPVVEAGNGWMAIVLASGLFVVSMMLGGIISVCDCPGAALGVALPASVTLARRRQR